MSVSAPFSPCGNTVVISATTTASTPVQVPSSTLGGNQYRIINSGSVVVILGYGQTSALAQAGAVVPTSTQNNCLPLLPGTDEIITFVPNAYFSANCVSGSATIYITCGDGD
jgi:hypothetical protein